ncbi:hypothetical protein [Bradyrhizobium viridifuturi]|uniref:hypothetical protein n=1 Tax=Bradyrhizobium viridifuturi TaxID=1654716 RepID=UPI000FE1477D|nr:hypothetical protein [Bradyrhizobium viridifuturi]
MITGSEIISLAAPARRAEDTAAFQRHQHLGDAARRAPITGIDTMIESPDGEQSSSSSGATVNQRPLSPLLAP